MAEERRLRVSTAVWYHLLAKRVVVCANSSDPGVQVARSIPKEPAAKFSQYNPS